MDFTEITIPPLSTCEKPSSTSHSNHQEAKAKLSEFGLYSKEDLKTRSLLFCQILQRSKNLNDMGVKNEDELANLVRLVIEDARNSLNLSGTLTIKSQIGLMKMRTDFWLIIDSNKMPIGVVEVKLPEIEKKKLDRIHGQIFDYLVMLRAFYGLKIVFGLLVTYEQWWAVWLPTASNAAKSQTRKDTKAEIKGKEQTDDNYADMLRESGDIERKFCISKPFARNDKDTPRMITTLLLKMYDAVVNVTRTAPTAVSHKRLYIQMESDNWNWKKISWETSELTNQMMKDTTTRFIFVTDLEGGADGRVWRAATPAGHNCAIKFSNTRDKVALEREKQYWEKVNPGLRKRGDWVRVATVGGAPALIMPFLGEEPKKITKQQRSSFIHKMKSLGEQRIHLDDLEPRHIRFYEDKCIIIDLARVTEKGYDGTQEAEKFLNQWEIKVVVDEEKKVKRATGRRVRDSELRLNKKDQIYDEHKK